MTQAQPAAASLSLSMLPSARRWRCPVCVVVPRRVPVVWWSGAMIALLFALAKFVMQLIPAVPTLLPTSLISTQPTTSPAGSQRIWTPHRITWPWPFPWVKSLRSLTWACSSVHHVPNLWQFTRAWTTVKPGCPTSSTPHSADVCTIGPTKPPLPSRTSRRLYAQMVTLTSTHFLEDSLLSAL